MLPQSPEHESPLFCASESAAGCPEVVALRFSPVRSQTARSVKKTGGAIGFFSFEECLGVRGRALGNSAAFSSSRARPDGSSEVGLSTFSFADAGFILFFFHAVQGVSFWAWNGRPGGWTF